MKTNEQKLIDKYADKLEVLKTLIKTAPDDATYVHHKGFPYGREPKRKSSNGEPQFMFVFNRGKWKNSNDYVSELNRTYASLSKLREMLGIK